MASGYGYIVDLTWANGGGRLGRAFFADTREGAESAARKWAAAALADDAAYETECFGPLERSG